MPWASANRAVAQSGPLYDPRTSTLHFVDITEKKVCAVGNAMIWASSPGQVFHLNTHNLELAIEQFNEPVSCLALRRNGPGVRCLNTLHRLSDLTWCSCSLLVPPLKVSHCLRTTQFWNTSARRCPLITYHTHVSTTVHAIARAVFLPEPYVPRNTAYMENYTDTILTVEGVMLLMKDRSLCVVDSAKPEGNFNCLHFKDANGLGWSPDEKILWAQDVQVVIHPLNKKSDISQTLWSTLFTHMITMTEDYRTAVSLSTL